jgi:branched-chain amino acid transport system ATP-binding protein
VAFGLLFAHSLNYVSFMLRVSNLQFRIGDSHILNGVNLEIARGEHVGIIGPNGSGKTTLFNCLSGFHTPQTGGLFFNNKNITPLSPSQRAHLGIGRLFQNFGIFRQMTVFENMLVAVEAKAAPCFFPWSKRQKEYQDRAYAHLRHAGLEEKANDKAGSLSGGQLRLLEIARLMAFGADLFLLDEPTAGVSPKMKHEIERSIFALHQTNATVLIIEHDINFIQRLCRRVVVLDVGQVVLDGTPEAVKSDPRLHDIYFGGDPDAVNHRAEPT